MPGRNGSDQSYCSASSEQSDLITVSVVSHGQLGLVSELLGDLASHCATPIEVVLTQNIPEPESLDTDSHPFPVRLVRNERPKGFGANHNAAFALSKGRYFCVINPDVRLRDDPFPLLLSVLAEERVGVAAPRVVSPTGAEEDNARPFPTALSIVRKAMVRSPVRGAADRELSASPDWVAGMFMLFRHEVFAQVRGFDENFFLYYEDVDICARLRQAGYDVRLEPQTTVTHDARRQSHHSLKYARWHLASMGRYLLRRYSGRYR